MPIQSWDEIKSALAVVRTGTLSQAATDLGMHHTTVLRHVESLERRLGVPLFLRHKRGYEPTAAGLRFQETAERMDQVASEVALAVQDHDDVTGELTMTTAPVLSGIAADTAYFLRRDHPALRVRVVSAPRNLRLERGEADIALRPGAPPDDPDVVIITLPPIAFALYGAPTYQVEHRHLSGQPLAAHRFIGTDGDESRAPHYQWLAAKVPDESIGFRSEDPATRLQAMLRGMGLGFLPVRTANRAGTLIQMAPPREWAVPVWIVTHRDLHRTARIQAAVNCLRRCARNYAHLPDSRRQKPAATRFPLKRHGIDRPTSLKGHHPGLAIPRRVP